MRPHFFMFPTILLVCAAGAAQETRPAGIDDLIEALGSSDFRTRERSAAALGGLGEAAIPALHRARKDADLERRQRAEAVLRVLTDLPATKAAAMSAEAAQAMAAGNYGKAAEVYSLLARRVRSTVEECLGHARALQMLEKWPESAAAYGRALERVEERLAGDPESDPPEQPAVWLNGAREAEIVDAARGGGWGGGGDAGGPLGRNGRRGIEGLSPYQQRELASLRAGLLLFVGRIQREMLKEPKAAAGTLVRIIAMVPEFQADLPTALKVIAEEYPRYQRRESVQRDIGRGLELINEVLILDDLAKLQEELGQAEEAVLTLARMNSALLRLRPDGVEEGVAALARLLRQSTAGDSPEAAAIIRMAPPVRPTDVVRAEAAPAVEAPFRAIATNLGSYDLGPLAVSDLVRLEDGRWWAVISAGPRLYTAFSRDLVMWEAPRLVPMHPLANNIEPAVTRENDGTLWLTWFANPFSLQPRGSGGYQLWISSTRDGRTWTPVRTIACDSGSGWPPGKLHWLKMADGRFRLSWRAVAATGESPSAIRTLSALGIKPFEPGWPMDPWVLQGDGGALKMVYQENTKGLAYAASADGMAWSDPELIVRTVPNRTTPGAPQLFGGKDGLAIFYQHDGVSWTIGGSGEKAGEWSAPVRIARPGVSRWVREGDELAGFTPGMSPFLVRGAMSDRVGVPARGR
jgi:tetratricopeptide (TPR) repeat protein